MIYFLVFSKNQKMINDADGDDMSCSVNNLLLKFFSNFFRQHNWLPCLLKEQESDNDADAGDSSVNVFLHQLLS